MRGRSKAPLRNRSFDLGASSELRDLEVSGSLDGTGAPVARESRDRSSNPAGHRGGRSGLRTSSAVHESHGTVHADGASRPSARSNAAGTWSPRPHRALRRRNPRPLIRGPDVLPPSSAPPGGMDRGFPLLGTLSWAGEVPPRRGNHGARRKRHHSSSSETVRLLEALPGWNLPRPVEAKPTAGQKARTARTIGPAVQTARVGKASCRSRSQPRAPSLDTT